MLTVAFLHPDLRLGGAERLVVDAATGLQGIGHRVVILTARHDPSQAFPETADGTLDVRVHGRSLPAHVGGHLRAPCAIARMAWLSLAATRLAPRPDVVVCDVVSHVIPLLRRRLAVPIIFYCHHPDPLLAPARGGVYRWYRAPIDRLGARGLAAADRVLVNSRFTAARLGATLPGASRVRPILLHPGVEVPAGGRPDTREADSFVVLSIGRFDVRKNLPLAIEALAELRARVRPSLFARAHLVLAGAYDPRDRDQRELLRSLERLVARLELGASVTFRVSPDEVERRALLAACSVVLFTPRAEHFGYVPLEAMAAGRPVVAANCGGPVETIIDGATGILCQPTPAAFGAGLARLLTDPEAAAGMGEAAREHVRARFSRREFTRRLDAIVRDAARR